MTFTWINNYKVDWQRGEVHLEQQIRSIEPRALQVLKVLVDANGQVISQQTILEQVWGDVVVAPNALQRCIAQIRKVFDDSAKLQSIIKTHPKLGYSLVAVCRSGDGSVNERTGVSEVPSAVGCQKPSKPYRRLSLAIGFMLLTMLAIVYWYPQTTSNFTTIIPITSSDYTERAATLANDGKTLAFIRGLSADHEQLILHDIDSGEESILITKAKFKGQIAFSPDDKRLAYGLLTFEGGNKCSQIMVVKLHSQQSQQLKACRHDFLHSPYWIDSQSLLYLRENKNAQQHLVRLRLSDDVETSIVNVPQSIESFTYFADENKLAVVSSAKQQRQLNIGTLTGSEFNANHDWLLPYANEQTLWPHWQNSQQVILANQKQIHWYRVNGESGQYPLLASDNLYNAIPYQLQSLIVEMGRSDWDVYQSNLIDSNNSDAVARSVFIESNGQFRPGTADVSVISTRSGKKQVWLSSQGNTRQLTHDDTGVDSYIWSLKGNKLAYLADNQLFILNLTNDNIRPLMLSEKVSEIFQWYKDDKGVEQLLLQMQIHQQPTIVSLNVDDLSYILEHQGASRWAQKVAAKTLIVNDSLGRLHQLVAGEFHVINAVAEVKLQWRYFFRDNAIYFQDKLFNVWRLAPKDDRAEIVGHLNESALIMTDILPQQQKLLSENFVKDRRELMLIQ
ncbi:winged helix-turn-helix domain-containing protein [Colwelliaceae bacterium 6471]